MLLNNLLELRRRLSEVGKLKKICQAECRPIAQAACQMRGTAERGQEKVDWLPMGVGES